MQLPDLMLDPRALAAVRTALAEDIGRGDATTQALVAPAAQARGASPPMIASIPMRTN